MQFVKNRTNNTMNKNPSPGIWSTTLYSETFPSSAHFPKELIEIKEVQERVIRLIRHIEWCLHEESREQGSSPWEETL